MRQMFSYRVQKPKQLLKQEADIIGFKFYPKEIFCQLWHYLLSSGVNQDNMFDLQIYFFKECKQSHHPFKNSEQETPGCVKKLGDLVFVFLCMYH